MYEQIAPFYDLIHAELAADIPFILSLAGRTAGPPEGGPVLELGCGTGRLLLPLARAGYTVTGLDNSPAMLARARARLVEAGEGVQAKVRLVEGDMTTFEVDGRYLLAVIPFNTLMHLEPVQVGAAFRQIGRHLVQGGRLVVDVANPLAVAQTPNDRLLTLEKCITDPQTGDVLVLMASSWVDAGDQTLHLAWLYDTSPAGGGPVQRTVAQMDYHYFFPHELELMLEAAGFALEAMYGDYEERPFGEESERLVVVGVKRGA